LTPSCDRLDAFFTRRVVPGERHETRDLAEVHVLDLIYIGLTLALFGLSLGMIRMFGRMR
jgi:hypothetical protein